MTNERSMKEQLKIRETAPEGTQPLTEAGQPDQEWEDIQGQWSRERIQNAQAHLLALFDTDDFDNRQYIYEKDVLWAFSIPAYVCNYVFLRVVCDLGQFRQP